MRRTLLGLTLSLATLSLAACGTKKAPNAPKASEDEKPAETEPAENMERKAAPPDGDDSAKPPGDPCEGGE